MKFNNLMKRLPRVSIIIILLAVMLPSDIQITQQMLDEIIRKDVNFWENVDKDYRNSMGNLKVLEQALMRMYIYELRFPTTFQELLHSPYMPVLPQDFINPYTGTPVKEVQGEPAAGDVKYTFDIEGPTIGIYLKVPAVDPDGRFSTRSPGELYYYPLHSMKRYAEIVKKTIPLREREFYIKLASGWPDEKKRIEAFCSGVEHLLSNAPYFYGKEVLNWTWEELRRRLDWMMNLRVRNPYTGEWIKPVDPRTPGPGDFSVIYDVYQESSMPGIVNYRGYALCTGYDKEGRPFLDFLMEKRLENNPKLHILQ